MKLIKKVKLKFFCDDANGEYGVTHLDTFEQYGTSFNAFWNGIGIFHDVWEHYFENNHKYFKGNYAMNVGGEMAAMGHMWYYQMKLGLYSKRRLNPQSIYSDGDNMRETTACLVQEAICYGYTNFGSTLESCIPKQSPVEDSELEYQIEKFWKDCKMWDNSEKYKDEHKASINYKKSISFRKIADLHRWGYREGERFVPNTHHNCEILRKFIDFWNEFCKVNDAKELHNSFKELHFYIYKEQGEISWKSKLISLDSSIPNYIIKSPHNVMEEIYF